jgi:hypothetical protein
MNVNVTHGLVESPATRGEVLILSNPEATSSGGSRQSMRGASLHRPERLRLQAAWPGFRAVASAGDPANKQPLALYDHTVPGSHPLNFPRPTHPLQVFQSDCN